MKNEIIEQLIFFPIKFGSSNPETLVLFGDRLEELTNDQAKYHVESMQLLINRLSELILVTKPTQIDAINDILCRGYTFCFDKAIENIYNLRARPTSNLIYDFKDMYEGNSGENVPEYLQLKVTPYLGTIVSIFRSLMDHITKNTKEYSEQKISLEELIKCVLYGGMQLGTEFCLRIDLDNTDEFDYLLRE